jgi:hypothetical protein
METKMKWSALMRNVIPPITDPLGQYWEQPSREEILIDDDYALMNSQTLSRLHDYSTTDPTGVYEGKMWRGREVIRQGQKLCFSDRWILRWFGLSDDPGKVSYNQRIILIVE